MSTQLVYSVNVEAESAPGLRQRLLDAAIVSLRDRGPEGTTLREIARRAGVSHGAPARHFPSLVALLSEVATGGFRELTAAVRAAASGSDDPRQRLACGGRAYISFALENPGVFGLMWRPDLVDFTEPGLADGSAAAFASLTDLVEAVQQMGWRADEDTRMVAGALWASVHGLAQLWLLGVLGRATGATSIDELSEVTFAQLTDFPAPPAPAQHALRYKSATTQRRR